MSLAPDGIAQPAAPTTQAPTATDTPAKGPRPVLQLVDVTKVFDGFAAVDGISLDIQEGEFVTIVGPSGSGKTTLLRMLAGLESPSEGYITLRGELINDVPSNKRPTCLVFQSLALFPHMTVGDNIEFPLKVRKMPAEARKKRALELLAKVRLPESYYGKNVMLCSGGEKQRVALARAFAYDPDVLFFDEPLSALDYKLKKLLEKELKDLHRESGKTFVYITHSLEEAMVMSDRIGVMKAGRLVQIGTPEQIYSTPADRFVAEFFGEVNVIPIRLASDGTWVRKDGKPIALKAPKGGLPPGPEAAVVIRPEYMHFVEDGAATENTVTGTIFNEYSLGSRLQYQVRGKSGRTFLIEVPRAAAWRGQGEVTLGWNAENAIVVGA